MAGRITASAPVPAPVRPESCFLLRAVAGVFFYPVSKTGQFEKPPFFLMDQKIPLPQPGEGNRTPDGQGRESGRMRLSFRSGRLWGGKEGKG